VEAGSGHLRIGELAKRTGASPELLRAWEQRYGLLSPSRSAGGFRLYSDQDEQRVRRTLELIHEGWSAGPAASQALSEIGSPAGPDDSPAAESRPVGVEHAEHLTAALDAFDPQGADRAFDAMLGSLSLNTVLADVLLPYLRRLGERWADGSATVAQEHFASNLIRGRLLGLARDWGSGDGPLVVLACPPEEEHDLGLIMFGLVVARRGWRVTFLGANTPFETLADAAQRLRPDLVVLTFSNPGKLERQAEDVRSLASWIPLKIGGAVPSEAIAALGAEPLQGSPVDAALTVRA
jgi:methanogenic corrinoid protein MtbC1